MATGCADGATVVMMTPTTNQGHSPQFGTTGAVCVELAGSVPQAWGCSGCDGRMVTITTGTMTSKPTAVPANSAVTGMIAAGPDGNIYFNFTAGTYTYAQMYVY